MDHSFILGALISKYPPVTGAVRIISNQPSANVVSNVVRITHVHTYLYVFVCEFPYLARNFLFGGLGGGVERSPLKKFTDPVQFLKSLTPLALIVTGTSQPGNGLFIITEKCVPRTRLTIGMRDGENSATAPDLQVVVLVATVQ